MRGTHHRRGAAGLLAALLALAACTDPRPRPVSPTVQIVMAPQQAIVSPGTLLGNVFISDPNGIDSMRVRVDLGNGALLGDSVYFITGTDDPFQTTLPLFWQIPGAVPNRTTVRVIARARSYIGFSSADTLVTAVGDTIH